HAPALERPPAARAPEPDEHLVGDQEHAVAVADLAHPRPVLVVGDGAAEARAADGLGEEGGRALGADLEDLLLELLRELRARARVTVGIGRIHVDAARHHVDVGGAQPSSPGGRERPEGHAVVALPAADDDVTLLLAARLL